MGHVAKRGEFLRSFAHGISPATARIAPLLNNLLKEAVRGESRTVGTSGSRHRERSDSNRPFHRQGMAVQLDPLDLV
jgi:hypothetical protein